MRNRGHLSPHLLVSDPSIEEKSSTPRRGMKVFVQPLLLALTSSLLLVLSFPNIDLELLAWIALVPLFYALHRVPPAVGFVTGFVHGVAFLMGVCYWINVLHGFHWYDFIFSGAYWGAYFGLFGLAAALVNVRTGWSMVVSAPVLWVSVEYLRSHFFFLNWPWALLAYSQYQNLPLIQVSSFTGAFGVSFLIVMVNSLLAEALIGLLKFRREASPALLRRLLMPACATVSLVALALVYGFLALTTQEMGEQLSLTVIQPNIPQQIKWDPARMRRNLEQHVAQTREAARHSRTALFVWPEAAVQGFIQEDFYLLQTLGGLARDINTYLLVGSSARPKFGPARSDRSRWLNGAFLISSAGTIENKYYKMLLLPFAEYLPYENVLPWPSRFKEYAGLFTPGREYTIFSTHGTHFAVLICWETIFSDFVREFVDKGAQFLINVTNEAWFGDTAAPYQFLAMSVFRAVENRVPVIRSANTGISCFIDPYGRDLGRVMIGDKDIFVEGYLTRTISLVRSKTFYTKYGDIFSIGALVASLLLIGRSLVPRWMSIPTDPRPTA